MMKFSKNDLIDNYRVVFPVKTGSYAETYRVKDSAGCNYLLKLFDYAKLDRTQYDSENGILELSIVQGFQHENITKYHDNGEVLVQGRKFAYVVYDYISGETVSERIQRDQYCTVFDAKQIVLGVLHGLEYLHTRDIPVIHNELTIQNVMLDMSDNVIHPIIIDFGHSRYLNQEYKSLIPDVPNLNPFYLAPEIKNGVFSVASDLYSVGALLYHLVFGRPPFYVDASKYKNREELDAAIAIERSKPVRILVRDRFEMDCNIINIIAKALSNDIDKRFSSATEFIKAINGEITIENINTDIPKNNTEQVAKKGKILKGKGFADVAGMDELKEKLRNDVIDLLNHPEEAKEWGISIPNGILFYGPPGCGKTYFAEKFAEEAGLNFISVSCSDIATPYIHGGQEKIAALFDEARKSAPTIIFLDEIDAMIGSRDNEDNSSMAGEVNEFLTQLNNCGEDGVLVIGATNRPNRIDRAALRAGRLELKYYIPQPDKSIRARLFEIYLKHTKTDLGINYERLADMTENYVSSQIRLIVDESVRKSRHDKQPFVTMDMLISVISSIQPDLSPHDIDMYNAMKMEFEGKSKQERRRIGFQ